MIWEWDATAQGPYLLGLSHGRPAISMPGRPLHTGHWAITMERVGHGALVGPINTGGCSSASPRAIGEL